MPDDELLALAEEKKLSQPDALRGQVERMLKDPKASAFTENFVGQWLSLREIDATIPSHILYPEYDDMLKASMLRETYLFFDEVLKNDLSLTNFVDSDFTMLNGRLAKHYGIPGVEGWEFQKMTLPRDSHRGGVMTMASVLKVTANGTYTSPVMRGAWVLERILGTPPPPPPEGRARHRARHPRRQDDPRATRQAPAVRLVRKLATARSTRPASPWRASTSSAAGAITTASAATAKRSSSTANACRTCKARRSIPSDVMPDGQKFSGHRRVQATAAEGQGPARPQPDRTAGDVCDRGRAATGRSEGDRGDCCRMCAARIMACVRWCMRWCRVGCFCTSSLRLVRGEKPMRPPIDWDEWCSPFIETRKTVVFGGKVEKAIAPPPDVANRLESPTPADVQWLCGALKSDEKKWFVAALAEKRPGRVAEVFLAPFLDAAIDERNPSFNRYFVEPCIKAFGHRRVNEYLLDVVELGTDFRKAGAINALYWAGMSLTFSGTPPAYTPEFAMPDSRDAYESLSDVWLRRRKLFLEEFVFNENIEVRQSLIPKLNLDAVAYPEPLRPLIPRAIEIARTHPDDYIRHRIEVQLGNEKLLEPLPQRS